MGRTTGLFFLAVYSLSLVAVANPDQNYESAVASEALGNFKKSAANYRRALRSMENSETAQIGLARVLIQLNSLDEAQDILTTFIERTNPLNAEAHLLLTDIYIGKAQFELAMQTVRTAQSLQPLSSDADSRKAVILFKMNRPEEAISMLTHALNTKSDVALRSYRAQAYFATGNWERAAEDLKTVVDEKPDDHESKRLLAKCYMKQLKWAEAEKVLKYLLKIDGKDQDVLQQLSTVYLSTKRPNEQVRTLKALVNTAPENLNFGQLLFDAYRKSANLKFAEEELRRELTIDSGYETAAQQLTELLNQQQRIEEVGSLLKNFVQLRPDSTWALTKYIELLVKYEKYPFAKAFLESTYAKTDRKAVHFALQGLILYHEGDLQRTASTLAEGLTLFPESAELKFNLALAYEKMEQAEQAAVLYRQIPEAHELSAKAKANLANLHEQTEPKAKSERDISSVKERGSVR